jgi:rubredoxin
MAAYAKSKEMLRLQAGAPCLRNVGLRGAKPPELCYDGLRQEREREMRYVCKICGYIYDPGLGDTESGIPEGMLFEELPEAWACPTCGAARAMFEPMRA